MKAFVPVGIATLILVVFIAYFSGGASDEFGTFLSVVAWVVVIAYGFIMYNKIYRQDKNSNRIDDPTSSTKVESSIRKVKQEEKPKETLSWVEPSRVEEKKEEPIKTEVTITAEEEEKIYADVAKELKDNRREGLWTKGFAECDGDEQKAKIAYINKPC